MLYSQSVACDSIASELQALNLKCLDVILSCVVLYRVSGALGVREGRILNESESVGSSFDMLVGL
jgi:hypothetical protein